MVSHMTAQPWMSVVVPAYNEEAAIAGTVIAVSDWLEKKGRPFEVIVVDNASEDGTLDALVPLRAQLPLRVLRNEANEGKGFSVRRGMLEASGELRLLCDSDCASSLASLDDMLRAIEEADVVAGSRVAPGAQVVRQQPWRRRVVGWPFIALTRLLLREPTRDIYCGFKLWRAAAAQAVFARQRVNGWAFDAESLAIARRIGFSIREVGIVWVNREASKLSIARTLVPALRELLAARRNVLGQRRVQGARPADVVADSSESGA